MSRQYKRPISRAEAEAWGLPRETHAAVAMAIHAIAGGTRSPEAIWESPTPAEWHHVAMAVNEYVSDGDFAPEESGRYQWGLEVIEV